MSFVPKEPCTVSDGDFFARHITELRPGYILVSFFKYFSLFTHFLIFYLFIEDLGRKPDPRVTKSFLGETLEKTQIGQQKCCLNASPMLFPSVYQEWQAASRIDVKGLKSKDEPSKPAGVSFNLPWLQKFFSMLQVKASIRSLAPRSCFLPPSAPGRG